MLVFPNWRPELPNEGCRALRWSPPERFAPYIARPVVYRPRPPQLEEEDTSGGSSPERNDTSNEEEATCAWRGCGAHFTGVARLSAHVARTHALPSSDGLFYCGWDSCTRPQRGFNARYKMLVHVRTHTNERPHTCNQCNKSFSRAENLKIHLRSHSGEKPYVCPYEGCGKAYSNSSDRFKHTRTHTVDKPYCCKVPGCNKRYTDPSSLRKHVKTYKHFVAKEIPRQESSDEHSRDMSPSNESQFGNREATVTYQTHIPYHSPPRAVKSPPSVDFTSIPSMATSSPTSRYSAVDTYMRPLNEPTLYPLRVPTYEMSYSEYTQMYERAYRSYYSSGIEYPVLRTSLCEMTYDDIKESNMAESMDMSRYSPMETVEMPLNLKCSKSTTIEELVKRDLPLDLSTKS